MISAIQFNHFYYYFIIYYLLFSRQSYGGTRTIFFIWLRLKIMNFQKII